MGELSSFLVAGKYAVQQLYTGVMLACLLNTDSNATNCFSTQWTWQFQKHTDKYPGWWNSPDILWWKLVHDWLEALWWLIKLTDVLLKHQNTQGLNITSKFVCSTCSVIITKNFNYLTLWVPTMTKVTRRNYSLSANVATLVTQPNQVFCNEFILLRYRPKRSCLL